GSNCDRRRSTSHVQTRWSLNGHFRSFEQRPELSNRFVRCSNAGIPNSPEFGVGGSLILRAICSLGLLLIPLAAEAQKAPATARVALVCGARCEGGGYDAFRHGLRELGWVEGDNVVVDVRGAEGQGDRLPALVAELLAAKPDIIVAVAPQPARAAKNATTTIPIVFVAVADPIALGLVT